MITVLKTPTHIKKMEYVCKLTGELLSILYKAIQQSVTTEYLEEVVVVFCENNKVKSAFKNYKNFPYSLCVSINDEIIHGFPGKYIIENGDVVSIDCGLSKDGFYADAAFTKVVGKYNEFLDRKKLVYATKECLKRGIEEAVIGNKIYDIGRVIFNTATSYGYDVVRDFVGHGVGFNLHEHPKIPNYEKKDLNYLLVPGMVIAIEPMVVEGSYKYVVDQNGWTVRTRDCKLSAHFEHTVAITDMGPVILTNF
jgi:methionyl aminopeptidase